MPAIESTLRPKLKAPADTCDTHMHVYDPKYPKAPTAKIDAPAAPVSAYLKMCARLGIERAVVVQPSTYGKDNRCTLEAVAAMGLNARCVVVVDQDVTDSELDRLTKLGARGIRFFMLAGAPLPWDVLEIMSARVAPFGWHVQLQLDGRDLPDRVAMLKRLTSTLVIDHVGKFLEPVPLDHPGFRALPGWLMVAVPGSNCRRLTKFRRWGRRTTTMSVNSPRRLQKPPPNGCYGPPIGRIRHQACRCQTMP
jgi:Predicted metal-dependent hydrolase of the TIM-barrel fold